MTDTPAVSPAVVAAIASSMIAMVAVVVSARSLRHSRRSSLTGILSKQCLELLTTLREYELVRKGFLESPYTTVDAKALRFADLKRKELDVFLAISRVQDLHEMGEKIHSMWSEALSIAEDSFIGPDGALLLAVDRTISLKALFEPECNRIRASIRKSMDDGYPR